MGQIANILRYNFAGNNEKRKLLANSQFVQALEGTGCYWKEDLDKFEADTSIVPKRLSGYKALVQTEQDAINNSTLVQEEVYREIIEGAKPFIVARQVLKTIHGKSYSMRFVKGEDPGYASKVSEIGAPGIHTNAYTKQDITIDDWADRPVISQDLIDDGLFDVVAGELQNAGARMENAINRECLDKILNQTGAITTNTMSPEGTHLAVTDLSRASKLIKKQNFMPDILLTHPTAEGYLLQDSNLAYTAYMGTSSPLVTGTVPKLMGLTPYTCTATDRASLPTWDDTTAGSDVTAIAFSKKDLGALVIREDINIKQYDDPIHNLVGIVLRMRFGFGVFKEKSGAIIYHK